jgi:hypothetical protein
MTFWESVGCSDNPAHLDGAGDEIHRWFMRCYRKIRKLSRLTSMVLSRVFNLGKIKELFNTIA